MERILDFSQPVVVSDIEEVVRAVYYSNVPTLIMDAETVLNQFKEHPDAYTRVDAVLSESQLPEALYFSLQVLDKCILGRWNVLPDEQRAGIKQFLVGFIMERCTNPHEMRLRHNRLVLNKVNATLVSVAKREWPHRWPEFVDEVVSSADFSPALAENAISILEILVEDIFEFGDKTMTSRWIERKKQALAQYFEKVWDLCGRMLLTDDTVLLNKVLSCVAKYVPYVGQELCLSEGFLMGITQFVENVATRCSALRVLTEVAQLSPPSNLAGLMETLFVEVMSRVVAWLPQGREDLATKTQMLYTNGSDDDEQFVDSFCLFITKFLPKNLMSLQHQSRDAIIAAHELLVGLLRIDNKEMFKTGVDYCWWLGDFILNPRHGQHGTASQMRHVLSNVLHDVRLVLIQKMAKPEEVIIVEDENGELQSEYMTDVDTIALYNTMRETLVFLTHINPRETDDTIRMLMARQVDGSDWGWGKLNCLCWAFGALSGAFDADVEKQSFVSFLRDLLLMCENTTSRNDRAVLAANIMYVAGQYPRFLRNHGRFLLTLVSKNVSFMKEEMAGVRDMAVETLVRVMRHCADILWVELNGTPARDMLSNVDVYVTNLNHSQAHTLFEALGYIVKAAPDGGEQAILSLLSSPNSAWSEMVNMAAQDGPQSVVTVDMLRSMIHVLRCFNRTAKTCGNAFIHQMKVVFSDLQALYVLYSTSITSLVEERGPQAMGLQIVKLLRAAKKEILRTVEEFVSNTDETQFVAEEVVPHLFNTFLTDYQSAIPEARDANVLAVITAGVNTLKGFMSAGTSHILAAVFTPTVELITQNNEDYPEHRVNLFALLRALNKECFQAFVEYVQQAPDVVYGLLWAAKHIDRNTCYAGLDTLTEIVKRIGLESDEAADHFFRNYTQQLVTDTLVAMLDTLHRPAFQRQVQLLSLVFQLSVSWGDTIDAPYAQSQLAEYLASQLTEIPTLAPEQIQSFVELCFTTCKSKLEFERIFADLMVEVQVWGAEQETQDIKEEERQMREQGIAGFARPQEGTNYSYMQDDEASFVEPSSY